MNDHKKEAILRHLDTSPQLLICMDICSKSGQVIFGDEPPELTIKLLAALLAEGRITRTFHQVHGIYWCEIQKAGGK